MNGDEPTDRRVSMRRWGDEDHDRLITISTKLDLLLAQFEKLPSQFADIRAEFIGGMTALRVQVEPRLQRLETDVQGLKDEHQRQAGAVAANRVWVASLGLGAGAVGSFVLAAIKWWIDNAGGKHP